MLVENGDLVIQKITNQDWNDVKDFYLITCYRENRWSKYTDVNYLDKIKEYISIQTNPL